MKTNKKYIDFQPSFRWLSNYPACFIAFGFGTGLAKFAPGTVGSLFAFIPAFFIFKLNLPHLFLFYLAFVLFFIGIWVADVTEKRLAVSDYKGVVIDEIVAMMLILSAIPFSYQWWLVSFILFRIFDIWKPWPINLFDKFVKGGFGTMLDDLIAALYVIIILLGVNFLLLT